MKLPGAKNHGCKEAGNKPCVRRMHSQPRINPPLPVWKPPGCFHRSGRSCVLTSSRTAVTALWIVSGRDIPTCGQAIGSSGDVSQSQAKKLGQGARARVQSKKSCIFKVLIQKPQNESLGVVDLKAVRPQVMEAPLHCSQWSWWLSFSRLAILPLHSRAGLVCR